MPSRLRLSVAAAMLAFALNACANVFYPDDRIISTAPEAPWSFIGKLTRAGSSRYCTGALVGSSYTVWTAAHCIWDFARDAPHSDGFYFVAREGLPPVPVKRYSLGTRSSRGIYYSGKDWAVLELSSPVQVGGYFALPVSSDVGDYAGMLDMGSFAEDRAMGKYLAAQSDCQVTGSLHWRGMLTHNCDTWHGSSGAPLFFRLGSDYVVALINTSQRGGSMRLMRYSPRYSNVGVPVEMELIEMTRKLIRLRLDSL